MKTVALPIVLAAALTPSARAASFDCGKARTLADHDDAIISISDDKITFGGEYGMNLSARQGFVHGDFPRVR